MQQADKHVTDWVPRIFYRETPVGGKCPPYILTAKLRPGKNASRAFSPLNSGRGRMSPTHFHRENLAGKKCPPYIFTNKLRLQHKVVPSFWCFQLQKVTGGHKNHPLPPTPKHKHCLLSFVLVVARWRKKSGLSSRKLVMCYGTGSC